MNKITVEEEFGEYQRQITELEGQLAAERELSEQARAAQRHINACRGLLKVPEGEVLYDAIEELQQQLAAERELTFEAQQAALREGIRSGEFERQLAAEQQKNSNCNEQIGELLAQLAAEQEKVNKLEGWCEQLQPHYDTVQELQKQLAAEREGGHWRIISEQLKSELATAREALEEIKRGGVRGSDTLWDGRTLQEVAGAALVKMKGMDGIT